MGVHVAPSQLIGFELFPDLGTRTPLWLSLLTVVVGAILGALTAIGSGKLDIVGVYIFAILLGFGGGLVRDIILGNTPPAALRLPHFLIAAFVFATLVWLIWYVRGGLPVRLTSIVNLLDWLFVGLLAIVAAQASLDKHLGIWAAVFVGSISSVGGAVLADIFLARIPSLVRPGPLVAVGGVLAAAIDTIAHEVLGFTAGVTSVVAILAAFAFQLIMRITGYSTKVIEATRTDATEEPA